MTEIEEETFLCCRDLTDVALPSSLKKIGDVSFSNCEKLRSITILEGVTDIGEIAFAACTSLIDVTLPASLKKMGDDVFSYDPLDYENNMPVTIHAQKGSYAEQYAKENGFAFCVI